MNKKKNLSKEDVLHLSKLSNLKLSQEEVEKSEKQFGETLTYIENLQELHTDDVEPTNQTIPLRNVGFDDGKDCKRMLTQDEALSNSKYKKGKNFVVKRIL